MNPSTSVHCPEPPQSFDRLPPMRWRAELPWLLALMLLAALVRWPVAEQARHAFDSDNALGPLMAREIARQCQGDAYWPLMLDGQDYIGALEAYLLVPFCAAAPGDPRAFAWFEICFFCLLVLPLCYRLMHACGGLVGSGRAGAICGGLLLAVGSPELLRLTTTAPIGYLSNLACGALVLLAGWRALERRSAGRLLVLGLASGVGFWNNPQIAVFVGAVLVALWTRGEYVSRGRAGSLALDLATPRGRLLYGLLGVSVLASLAILALPFVIPDGWHGALLGVPLSLGRPAQYLPRGIVAVALSLLLLEWHLAPTPTLWLRRALAFAFGFALGASPWTLHHALGRGLHHPAWSRWQLHTAPEFFHGFLEYADLVLLTPLEALLWPPRAVPLEQASAQAAWLYPVLYLAVVYALLRSIEALVRWRGAELSALVRLRGAMSAPVMLVAPAVLLAGVSTLRGGLHDRYLLALWLPAMAIVAVVAGRAWREGSRAALVGAMALALGFFAVGDLALVLDQLPQRRALAVEEDAVIASLERAGVTHASGNYWVAYKWTFLTDRRLTVGCDLDPSGNYDRFGEWKRLAEQQHHAVRIFDLARPEEHRKWAEMHRAGFAERIEREWSISARFRVVQYH